MKERSESRPGDSPLISVVMSVYNGTPYLEETIESILRQTHGNLEFIVTDDGSSDESASIIRSRAAGDARIRPLFRTHSGIGGADNAGVRAARGEWIARMDQDDIALPERLEVQLAYMRETGADICGSLAESFGTEKKLYWFPESHEGIRRALLIYIAVLQPTVLMKARILKDNPYDERTYAADYELWTRLVPVCRMANVPRVLLKYRRHDRQATGTEKARFVADMRKIRFRYFYTLFPGTPLSDVLPLSRIADHLAMPSLSDLERAGRWLKDLFADQAPGLREFMAGRWQKTWERSSHLGPDGEVIYRRYLEELEVRR
jgi:glycosyltransferase involved in cell wall biosynthesis